MKDTTKGREIQCHFISNTHWDREWRYSAQRTRYMLGDMLEMLWDIFEKEPGFRHFHLDSQTLPLQDYLEAHPEREELVRRHVSEGRLAVGPWFCLPDSFCVAGESLVRNLLLGHRIAKRFGAVSKTGYSPFGWGQISQMPQIYAGFGIDMASFYRGVNLSMAPKSEFLWESPDGTRILGSRLGVRPRYNIWYIVQRPAYWGEQDENNRVISWKRGNAPFRFVDPARCELDYQYAHPAFGYSAQSVPERAAQAIAEQDNDWSTEHRFWSVGHDSSCPDIRETRMIDDCGRALAGRARVFHSSVRQWQEGVKASVRPAELPVLKGEMHEPATRGSPSLLMGWIISSRTYIKQENFRTERELACYAEPLAVAASLIGAPYPDRFIDLAWNYLLQNHGHDSIAGCGRDIVSEDVMYRYRQSREISGCVTEKAFMDVAGDIDLSAWSPEDMAIVVFNPAPFPRTETSELVVEIPREWGAASFELLDEKGTKVGLQFCDEVKPCNSVVQSPNDVANTYPSTRHYVRARLPEIPGMGYRTFKAVGVSNSPAVRAGGMCPSIRTIENDLLRVSVNANGTFDLVEKKTGNAYRGLGYFRDQGEIGNPWQHVSPPSDAMYTTLSEKAEVTLVRDGPLEASLRVEIEWALPEGRAHDEKSRNGRLRTFPIVSTLTLRDGEGWVEVVTEVDNTVEDHYLQVSFPTGIDARFTAAQGQFDVVSRPVALSESPLFMEPPMTEQPMNSFVDLSDGHRGIAFLNEGLKAYEAHRDEDHTLSLTLLRCYPLRICVTQDMLDYSRLEKGSQCLGKNRFRYAVMPHAGSWEDGKVWQAAERFNLPLCAAQIGPSRHGKNPLTRAFLEFSSDGLHLSAVKRSEDGRGWVVRIFNPSSATVRNAIRLNGGRCGPAPVQSPVERLKAELALPGEGGAPWGTVEEVSLEELPLRTLRMNDDGWVKLEITRKKIMTLKFVP